MNISELPTPFEFVFLSELEEISFAFRLSENSKYIYLSEELRPLLTDDFDTIFDELVLVDFSSAEIHEIELPVLKELKIIEQKKSEQPDSPLTDALSALQEKLS